MAILRSSNKNMVVARDRNGVAIFLSYGRRFAKGDDDNRTFASRGSLTGGLSSPKQLVSARRLLPVVIGWFVLEATKIRRDGNKHRRNNDDDDDDDNDDDDDGTIAKTMPGRQHRRSGRVGRERIFLGRMQK
jgi:hypothetical protein